MYNKTSSCYAVCNRSVRDGLNMLNTESTYKQFHSISLAGTPCVLQCLHKKRGKKQKKKKNKIYAMLWWLKTQPCFSYQNIHLTQVYKKLEKQKNCVYRYLKELMWFNFDQR